MVNVWVNGDRSFRVEHRVGDETTPLGDLSGVVPHVSLLDPWASRLRREGGTGELRLVHKGTGQLVARQDLEEPPRWRGATRPRDPNRALSTVGARVEMEHLRQATGADGDD
jgi:hypothetical protein